MNPQTTNLTPFAAPALLKTSSNHDPLLSQTFYDAHEDLTQFNSSENSSSNVGVAPQFAMTFLQYLEESESSGNSGYYEEENMGEVGFNPESFVFSELQQQPQYHFMEENISNNIVNTVPKMEKVPSSNFGQSIIPQPISSGAALIPPEVHQHQQLRYEMRILGVPSKSRVETQLKLCIQLVQKHSQPGNTSNVTAYKYLLLPESFTVGSKTSKKDIKVKIEPSLNCLRLEAGIVCASDQTKEVSRCFGCIQRERKITQRKKKAEDFEDTSNQGQFIDEERKKILQFYANPQIDFGFGETILPTRITCYCRHHEERTGFQIWIVLRDSKTNQAVAAAISPPVMITDDHKSKAKQPTPSLGGTKRQRLAEVISAIPVATPIVVSPASTPVPTPFFTPNPMIPANFNIKKEEFFMQQDSPVIEKIIPSEGPVTGGIEVTILGKDFISNQTSSSSLGHPPNVIVLFGECEALKTSVWGSQTLVSVVPPSLFPGAVPVSIKGAKSATQEPVFFTYKDDTDRMMMELALQVVGVKLTGKIDDAKQIALKIVNSNQDTFTRAMQLQQQQQQNGRQNSLQESPVHFYHKNTEDLIYFCISQLFENHTLNGYAVDLNQIKHKGTQHTLLMLAVVQGAHNLAELCLKHGADVNVQDANGYTALHYASMHGYIAMTKLLLTQSHNNVDLSLKTITGKTAVKIAQDFGNTSVVDILNHYMINGNRFGSAELNAGSFASNINMNLNVNVNVSYSTPSGPQSRRTSFSKELVNPSHIQIPLPSLIPTLHPAHNHPLMQEEKDDVSLLMEDEEQPKEIIPKKLPETCRTEMHMNTPSSFNLRPFGSFFAERRQLWTVVMAVVVGTLMVSVVLLPLSTRNQEIQKDAVEPSGSLQHDNSSGTTDGSTTVTKSSTSDDISLKFLVLAVYFLMAVLIMLPLFYRYRKVWKVKQVLYGLGILLVMFGYLIFEYWGDEQ